MNVRSLLQDVPGLLDQVEFEVSAVHALALDPRDDRRIAFQLGALRYACAGAAEPPPVGPACGWSGVVDILALTITHIHCPVPPWRAAGDVRPPAQSPACDVLAAEPPLAALHAWTAGAAVGDSASALLVI